MPVPHIVVRPQTKSCCIPSYGCNPKCCDNTFINEYFNADMLRTEICNSVFTTTSTGSLSDLANAICNNMFISADFPVDIFLQVGTEMLFVATIVNGVCETQSVDTNVIPAGTYTLFVDQKSCKQIIIT